MADVFKSKVHIVLVVCMANIISRSVIIIYSWKMVNVVAFVLFTKSWNGNRFYVPWFASVDFVIQIIYSSLLYWCLFGRKLLLYLPVLFVTLRSFTSGRTRSVHDYFGTYHFSGVTPSCSVPLHVVTLIYHVGNRTLRPYSIMRIWNRFRI